MIKEICNEDKKTCICICDLCGKEFSRYYNYAKKSKKHYCSLKCLNSIRKGKLLGEENPNWKGGKYKTKQGYIIIRDNYGERIPEHIVIVEKYLDRKLYDNEEIHHINEDKADNRLENLVVLAKDEHRVLHHVIRFLEKYGSLENFVERKRLIKL